MPYPYMNLQVCLGVILYGKAMSQKLSQANSFCTNPSLVAACNAALPWATLVPPAAGACPAAAATGCDLAQAWGAASVQANATSFPPGPLPVPLDVNTSVWPTRGAGGGGGILCCGGGRGGARRGQDGQQGRAGWGGGSCVRPWPGYGGRGSGQTLLGYGSAH